MKQGLGRVFRGTAAVGVAALGLSLVGCGNFFVPQTSTSGSGSTTVTGDFAYVSNSTSGSTSISAYGLSAGTLAPLATASYNLTYVPTALAITRNNAFMYAASQTGGLYLYTISTAGVLTVANSGAPLLSQSIAAMDVSTDGNYLFTVDLLGQTLTQFTINSSTGFLTSSTAATQLPVNAILGNQCSVVLPCAVKVAPSGSYVAVALGTSGSVIYPFSNGVLSAGIPIPLASGVGDYGVTIDASNNVYFARTNGVAVYTLSGGTATTTNTLPNNGAPGTRGIVLNSAGTYLYEGSYNATGTIYQYSVGTNGVLTALAPTTVAAPSNVFSLALDNSGKYVLALGYNNSSGLELYSIGSGGTLTAAGTAVATGASTSVPAVMALTH